MKRIEDLEAEVQQLQQSKSRSVLTNRPIYPNVANVVKSVTPEGITGVPVIGDVVSPGEGLLSKYPVLCSL